jgi:hypothetical protein
MHGPALPMISFWVGVGYWQISRCYRDFDSLIWCQRLASSVVVYNDLIYKITNFHFTKCLTFFIPIFRPFLAHWPWRRITSHHGGCDGSAGHAYILLLGTWSHLRYADHTRASVLVHSFLWLVIPTCVSRLITVWYLSHFTHVLHNGCAVSTIVSKVQHDKLNLLKIGYTQCHITSSI